MSVWSTSKAPTPQIIKHNLLEQKIQNDGKFLNQSILFSRHGDQVKYESDQQTVVSFGELVAIDVNVPGNKNISKLRKYH